MKILLIITLAVLAALNLNGQINPMDQLFKDKPRDLELYLNPTFEYSQIALNRTMIGGLGGGVIINKKISIGAVYNMIPKNIPLPPAIGTGRFQMIRGGLHLEYTLWPLQKVHLTFPLSAGVGQLKITGNRAGTVSGSPNFIFTEPGIIIEANIWRYAKFGIGTSYRYTGNVSYDSLTPADLSGFAAVVSLKFGNFRYSLHQ